MLWPNKNFIFRCSHCFSAIFILTTYSFYAQSMLILILIDVQYLQNVIFSSKNVQMVKPRQIPTTR